MANEERFKLTLGQGATALVFNDLLREQFEIAWAWGVEGTDMWKITVDGHGVYEVHDYTIGLTPKLVSPSALYAASPSLYAKTLNNMRDMVHRLAVEKGWWEPDSINRQANEPPESAKTFTEAIMLVVTECAEAVEEFRDGKEPAYTYHAVNPPNGVIVNPKPEGIPIELADIIIRVLDIAGQWNIDIGTALVDKHAYNKSREHRHGGKKL